MTDKEILLGAIRSWGKLVATDRFMEKSAELHLELLLFRRGRPSKVMERLAEVSILVEELGMAYGVEGDFERARVEGIKRLAERLGVTYNGEEEYL